MDKRKSVRFNTKTQEFDGLDDKALAQLKQLYAAVDVDAELKRMGLWLLDKPGRKGSMTFILHWLGNAAKSSTNVPAKAIAETEASENPLTDLISLYLKDLWQGNEHLHRFNTFYPSQKR